MNRSQYLAAIKATFPGMTARFTDGEFRVSLSPDAIKAAYPEYSHAEAMARNESLAAYEMDGDSALLTARAIAESWRAELAERKAAVAREAAGKSQPETIDMTPTWAAVVNVFIACLEDGTETGRQAARTELRRMAALADERNVFAAKLAAMQDAGK